MKELIKQKIEEWIGDDVQEKGEIKMSYANGNSYTMKVDSDRASFYNQSLQDLRNKVPELTEKIIEEVVREIESIKMPEQRTTSEKLSLIAYGWQMFKNHILYKLRGFPPEK